MLDIAKIYNEYAEIAIDDLSTKQKTDLLQILKGTQPEDLRTVDEHRMYIEVLQKLRMSNIMDLEIAGEGFISTLRSLLSVGEDGVYSNNQRFLYELIQNVDDCEYENPEDCRLDIRFEYNTNPGRIVLRYNETGFTPENVVAITGIAAKSKNISPDKIEIGEKGIGFKSVFGIADKVHIESGSFSFELNRDSFTVPVPKYEGFTPFEGTRMTLEMPYSDVEKLYKGMVEQYKHDDSILNKNPILFLNKITRLKMYFDGFRYIDFKIERKKTEFIGNITFENDIDVSIDMKHDDSVMGEIAYSKTIKCKRYTQPIIYGEKECKSRYGQDSLFSERRHNLIALFPTSLEEVKNYKGLLYSFLPTQIKMTVPIILHVPFKLNASREFVHAQDENEWFEYTVEKLGTFLKAIYVHLASLIKQDVIKYIPGKNIFFFEKTNEKIECLLKDNLKGSSICSEKVFYTTDERFESMEDIVSFAKSEKIDNPREVFALLDEKKKLFIPNSSTDMRQYGVKVISDVPIKLFKIGLRDETKFKHIAQVLDEIGKDLKYVELVAECCPIELTQSQLYELRNHKQIRDAFYKYSTQCISKGKKPEIIFGNEISPATEKFCDTIKELVTVDSLEQNFVSYLEFIQYKFFVLNNIKDRKDRFVLAGKNGIVVSANFPTGSFAKLVSKYDPQKIFTATLNFRQASATLNAADETMSNSEYLNLLLIVRNFVKDTLGERAYNSYIHLINQSGVEENRFVNELLQNADDCTYADGVTPFFELKMNERQIVVSYNETGFTKQNVRAITAIGESTKKLLLGREDRSIGEKGVGFKSVFGVAESVEIHSNGFDFKLTDRFPTIPEKCDDLKKKDKPGTTMIFSMKSDVRRMLKKDRILRLCLCLRNLRKIRIGGIRVSINDTENERIISIGDTTYHFEKFEYEFEIEDPRAIEERSRNQKIVSKKQRICCYIPKEYMQEKYLLYVGLPTRVECKIPLIIDAPFELTTSRESVVKSRWNDCVRDAIYEAIFELMTYKKRELRIDVLKYAKSTQDFQTFSEEYLNEFDWIENLKNESILPVLNSDRFVSAAEENCIIVPDVIGFILKREEAVDEYDGVIIDTYKRNKYLSLLESMDCQKSDIEEELNVIQLVAERLIGDDKFRGMLYDYLALPNTQHRIHSRGLYNMVKKTPIFPIRTRSGIEYVSYSEKMYTHETKNSDNEFLILASNIMDHVKFQAILGPSVRINELTEEVYEARYRNNLITYIRSDRSDKEKAIFLLNEFNNNFANFSRCKESLRGMIEDIPMESMCREYLPGYKFVNKSRVDFKGEVINKLIVSDSFSPLAEFLVCRDILGIHFDDIDLEVESLSDQDIEEFQEYFIYGAEILEHFVNCDAIQDDQIERFDLQYLTMSSNSIGDDYENFPSNAVTNLQRLRDHVRNQFIFSPNPYEEKKKIVREPRRKVNKEEYLTSMYGSRINKRKCFCQMCKKSYSMEYIERNVIQKEPQYGWEQMYVNLCLHCSKDFISMRNNKYVWKKFIEEINNANIMDDDIVMISIGNKELAFTATHLAEIQTILELEKEKTGQ